jgi:hypothetical protein
MKTADWEAYLKAESNLPGPRGNIELGKAVARCGSEQQILALIRWTAEMAPENTPQSYLSFCGTLGLGKLIADGQDSHISTLKKQANDPRWRTREAAAMALQTVGDQNPALLLNICSDWKGSSWLEQRAVVAGLCEPRLLNSPDFAEQVIEILDEITMHIQLEKENRSENYRSLRQALGYGWSVIIAATPLNGKAYLEKWAKIAHPDIRWIVKENLKKNRLKRLDTEWVSKITSSL